MISFNFAIEPARREEYDVSPSPLITCVAITRSFHECPSKLSSAYSAKIQRSHIFKCMYSEATCI